MSPVVVSGMRPTGRLHLGHYHGVLKNWLRLQNSAECYFFVADWHALTTHYETPGGIAEASWDLLTEWLAVGIDPERATLFLQSWVPQHAELALLLGMLTPLSWLERVPTFKDQQEKLRERDLATYGFLGYPLLMTADILLYGAEEVPVGADQVAHLEISRELARRFNFLYGREADAPARVADAEKRMGKAWTRAYRDLVQRYRTAGDVQAVEEAQALLAEACSLSADDRALLLRELQGRGREILVEPRALLTEAARMPGLDGQKMSKSYGNTIALREDPDSVRQKLRTMPTDPARVRRQDPGDPDKCPVFALHQVYSDAQRREWVVAGCRSAGIGCLECKSPLIDSVLEELAPIRERAEFWAARPAELRDLAKQGAARARRRAEGTLDRVRAAMGLVLGDDHPR
ncbi:MULTISPECIES: tryptophan--tRNA ligase [Acidithiobacillus]|uniref:Tryptophan--tRNA ligase n=2 Tax=Acidithiobacillus caldus TaxID=33059 RepID=F9ZQE0_ACICS|nr:MULTISPECIES: tryptophan--tRNA ligase [Acidithiobacillus]AEK58357.1 Tryptophanyl-tRNA synthetase [Acidithiobacillus caldus SM-1]AUW32958.1 tryptophan--tRNA ligase [Acidithiobacillus caldus]MCE5419255.1 tryptophan--tRNA ligase [Acidithiobacillus sp.]QER45765.1 tryptophanyl-tRNA synthetase [Acidithiobacillus caldus]WMT47357.1 MAG: tryptophan--tRNA ligase [Acidithiobacillus caldus]